MRILRLYEGLFLIDNAYANTELDTVVKHIHDILQKNGAEILKSENWGEKKLAYKVNGHKRGTYFLIHFNAKSMAVAAIRRDLQLSDSIIRFLIVKDSKIEDVSQIGITEPEAAKDINRIPEPATEELLEEADMAINTSNDVQL
ncbi:MAG: 30S ribosomal protein S6 [wastewater metagenome]|nr:30S ribosomal protein S6 [Candidatus Loosdrechtia aerotolerans]